MATASSNIAEMQSTAPIPNERSGKAGATGDRDKKSEKKSKQKPIDNEDITCTEADDRDHRVEDGNFIMTEVERLRLFRISIKTNCAVITLMINSLLIVGVLGLVISLLVFQQHVSKEDKAISSIYDAREGLEMYDVVSSINKTVLKGFGLATNYKRLSIQYLSSNVVINKANNPNQIHVISVSQNTIGVLYIKPKQPSTMLYAFTVSTETGVATSPVEYVLSSTAAVTSLVSVGLVATSNAAVFYSMAPIVNNTVSTATYYLQHVAFDCSAGCFIEPPLVVTDSVDSVANQAEMITLRSTATAVIVYPTAGHRCVMTAFNRKIGKSASNWTRLDVVPTLALPQVADCTAPFMIELPPVATSANVLVAVSSQMYVISISAVSLLFRYYRGPNGLEGFKGFECSSPTGIQVTPTASVTIALTSSIMYMACSLQSGEVFATVGYVAATSGTEEWSLTLSPFSKLPNLVIPDSLSLIITQSNGRAFLAYTTISSELQIVRVNQFLNTTVVVEFSQNVTVEGVSGESAACLDSSGSIVCVSLANSAGGLLVSDRFLLTTSSWIGGMRLVGIVTEVQKGNRVRVVHKGPLDFPGAVSLQQYSVTPQGRLTTQIAGRVVGYALSDSIYVDFGLF